MTTTCWTSASMFSPVVGCVVQVPRRTDMTSCRSVERAWATQQYMASCVRRTRRSDIWTVGERKGYKRAGSFALVELGLRQG